MAYINTINIIVLDYIITIVINIDNYNIAIYLKYTHTLLGYLSQRCYFFRAFSLAMTCPLVNQKYRQSFSELKY